MTNSRDQRTSSAQGWRRLAAYAIDSLGIAAYMGALFGLNAGARNLLGLGLDAPESTRDRLIGHAIALSTLTLPVALYFALMESSPRQATVGKRVLGLKVTDLDGQRIPAGQSLKRSAVKFAPWEMAHTALWHTAGWPANAQPGPINWVFFILPMLLAGGYVGALFIGARRTLYDRIAGTRVE